MKSPSSSPRRPSNAGPQQAVAFADYLNAAVIHRVLLTDPKDLTTLSATGKRRLTTTPTFEEFSDELEQVTEPSRPFRFQEHLDTPALKRAYRDHICDTVYTTRQMEPLRNLLLELHDKLKSLIPNRTDLHGILHDNDDEFMTTPSAALPAILKAARALEQLESEERSETTRAWIAKAKSIDSNTMDLEPFIDYLVTSLLYMLWKTDLCDQDKKDYYLWTIWAPQIYSGGHQYERDKFEKRYGKLSDPQTAPLTRQWVVSLVQEQDERSRQMLSSNQTAREELVKRGWVESVVFRSVDRSSLALPEILALDSEYLNEIRDMTRSAAAGSALALHACNAAGVASTILSQVLDSSSAAALRQKGISDAMENRQGARTIEEYEEEVALQVVALANEWANPALSDEAVAVLKSQTSSVLKGKDPVIKLLDGRMKEVFSQLVTRTAQAPSGMRTGIDRGGTKTGVHEAFLTDAEAEFRRRGLSFYAAELAKACLLAKKVIDLAWTSFGESLVDRMVVEACTEADRGP